ncbi:MAG TPA: hypothetical protein VGF58_00060 [Burkholderiales bacterium]
MALVPSAAVPRSNFVTFSKGRPQGAATGALVGGATTGLAVLVVAGTAGAAAPYAFVLAPIFIGAGAVGGAIGGTVAAVPAEKAKEIERAITAWSASLDSQRALAEHVAAAAANVRVVRLAPRAQADSVLDLAIEAIEFEGCIERRPFDPRACPGGTQNPALALTLQARARLMAAASGEELFARGFRYHSARRELARWLADDGRLLSEELERAYEDLGGRIHDAFFLTSSTETAQSSTLTGLPGSDPEYGLCWLAPRSPAAQPVLVSEMWTLPFAKGEICEASAIRFPRVDSLQPLLRWDAFPRARDSQDVDSVTYDLKVWAVEDCARGALAYERSGLRLPEHRLEAPLAAGQRYLWTFRARYAAKGRPAATPWSFFAPGTTCELSEIPDGQWHRFVTPRAP